MLRRDYDRGFACYVIRFVNGKFRVICDLNTVLVGLKIPLSYRDRSRIMVLLYFKMIDRIFDIRISFLFLLDSRSWKHFL